MEKDVRKIIQSLAETAQTATEDARDFMQQKTEAVTEKTAAVRYGLELARVKSEQNDQFAEIGRMMFLIKSGIADADKPYADTNKTPQQTIDAMFIIAEQSQQQIDALNEKIAEAKAGNADKRICPLCGRECNDNDAFCSKCGTKL